MVKRSELSVNTEVLEKMAEIAASLVNDGDHIFHSTLFINDNAWKCRLIYEALSEDFLPKALTAERFQICLSDTGEPGSFHIIREIKV